MSTVTKFTQACEKQGLVFLGVTGLDYAEDYARFRAWIAAKRHAKLEYLEKYPELRENPRGLLSGAKSALIVALPYFFSDDSPRPTVSLYARFRDYHHVLRDKADKVAREIFPLGTYRVVVDSAPILEKALAARTTRGFIGKNTLYIHPEKGSYLLLGEILNQSELDPDSPRPLDLSRKTRDGGCGPCRLCQGACPTGALDEAYSLDASKCLSYWTIEQRGTIPEAFWPWLKDYYFGCDHCQTACPYNKKAQPHPADWKPRALPPLDKVATLSQAEYEGWFGGTPLTRAKRSGLRRNALIAMAVTRHPELEKVLPLAESDTEEMLRETARQIRAWVSNIGP